MRTEMRDNSNLSAISPRNNNHNLNPAMFNTQTIQDSGTFYSKQSTVTGPMSQWVKEGRFEETEALPEDDRRKALADYTFDSLEVDDFLNDPRLMSLAHIKFMNGEDKEREEMKGVD